MAGCTNTLNPASLVERLVNQNGSLRRVGNISDIEIGWVTVNVGGRAPLEINVVGNRADLKVPYTRGLAVNPIHRRRGWLR